MTKNAKMMKNPKMTRNYKNSRLAKVAIRELAEDFSWEIIGSEMLSFMSGIESRKFLEKFIEKFDVEEQTS